MTTATTPKWLDGVAPQATRGPTKALTIKLPEDIYRHLKAYCAHSGATVQDIGVEGIKLALRARGAPV